MIISPKYNYEKKYPPLKTAKAPIAGSSINILPFIIFALIMISKKTVCVNTDTHFVAFQLGMHARTQHYILMFEGRIRPKTFLQKISFAIHKFFYQKQYENLKKHLLLATELHNAIVYSKVRKNVGIAQNS